MEGQETSGAQGQPGSQPMTPPKGLVEITAVGYGFHGSYLPKEVLIRIAGNSESERYVRIDIMRRELGIEAHQGNVKLLGGLVLGVIVGGVLAALVWALWLLGLVS